MSNSKLGQGHENAGYPETAKASQTASVASVSRDEANLKVLELMSESFHGNALDSAVRPPTMASAKRLARGSSFKANHAVASGRTGPSPAAAAVTVSKALSAVNNRIVGLLLQPDVEETTGARVELALLSSLHRSLQNYGHRIAADVILCDTIAGFADSVPEILADLEAGGSRQLGRLLDYSRELMTELTALGGAEMTAPFKQPWRDARTAVDKTLAKRSLQTEKSLKPARENTYRVYSAIAAALERCCPRRQAGLLDEMMQSRSMAE